MSSPKPTDKPEFIDRSDWVAAQKKKRTASYCFLGFVLVSGLVLLAHYFPGVMHLKAGRSNSELGAWREPIETIRGYDERVWSLSRSGFGFEPYREEAVIGDNWQISYLDGRLIYTGMGPIITTFDRAANELFTNQNYSGTSGFLERIDEALIVCEEGQAKFTIGRSDPGGGMTYQITEESIRYSVTTDSNRRPVSAKFEAKILDRWVVIGKAVFDYSAKEIDPPGGPGVRTVNLNGLTTWEAKTGPPIARHPLGTGNLSLCNASVSDFGTIYLFFTGDQIPALMRASARVSVNGANYRSSLNHLYNRGTEPSHTMVVTARRLFPEKIHWPLQVHVTVSAGLGEQASFDWTAKSSSCAIAPDWMTSSEASDLYVRNTLDSLYVERSEFEIKKGEAIQKSGSSSAAIRDWVRGSLWANAALVNFFLSGGPYRNQLDADSISRDWRALAANLTNLGDKRGAELALKQAG